MGNSGGQRGVMGCSLGAVSILLGILLTLFLALFDKPRAFRTFSLPLYWLGALIAAASLQQVHFWSIYLYSRLQGTDLRRHLPLGFLSPSTLLSLHR